jgi:hypothetical protein
MRALLIGFLGLVYAACAPAAVYKWVDEHGNTIYSDRPQPGATELKGDRAVQTVESFKARPKPPTAPTPKALPYDVVAFTAPAADATFRDEGGNVSVAVTLKPALQVQFGHRLALYVDGKPHAKPGSVLSFRLTNVDRGTHQLRAVIVDGAGTEIASGSTTFHMHRTSVKKKPPAKPPAKPQAPKPPAPKPAA